MRASTALDALWVATRLHMLSLANGATTSFEQKVISGEKETYGPRFHHHELAEFELRWRFARSVSDKEGVLWDALEILFYLAPPTRKHNALPFMREDRRDQLRKLTIGQVRHTREWRNAISEDARPAAEVALAYGVRKAMVLACREEFKNGRPHGGARNGAGRPAIQGSRS